MDLSAFYRGFVKNYASFNIQTFSKRTKRTGKEIGYFRQLGEMLGYYVFQEDEREIRGKKRKGDLFWTSYDKEDNTYYYELHLERESKQSIAEETIEEKLADDISNLIAIVYSSIENVKTLYKLAEEKIRKNKDVEELLLIVYVSVGVKEKNDMYLILGKYYWKEKNKVNQENYKAVRLTNEAGFHYAILEEEFSETEWNALEEKMIDSKKYL